MSYGESSSQTHKTSALLHIKPHQGWLGQNICCHVLSGDEGRFDESKVSLSQNLLSEMDWAGIEPATICALGWMLYH